MSNAEERLAPTYSIPGPGGSLGKCALCGECFLQEILFGETVAMMECSLFPGKNLPFHHKCAKQLKDTKIATELPQGPLRTAWERSQHASQ